MVFSRSSGVFSASAGAGVRSIAVLCPSASPPDFAGSRSCWVRARLAWRNAGEGVPHPSLQGEVGPCSSPVGLRATGFLCDQVGTASRAGPGYLVHVAYCILKLLPPSSPHQRAHLFLVPVNGPAVVISAVLWALRTGSPAAQSLPGQRWSDAVLTTVDGASPWQGAMSIRHAQPIPSPWLQGSLGTVGGDPCWPVTPQSPW